MNPSSNSNPDRHTGLDPIRQTAASIPMHGNQGQTTFFDEALNIRVGDMASMIYADLNRADDDSERQKIRASLLEYCKLDTLVMVMIWQELGKIAEMR